MTCTIIALIVTCAGTPVHETPSRAAEILVQAAPPFKAAPPAISWPDGPTVASTGSAPQDAPASPRATIPDRRLDGSSWADPPWILHEHVGPYRGGRDYVSGRDHGRGRR